MTAWYGQQTKSAENTAHDLKNVDRICAPAIHYSAVNQ